MSFEKKKLPKKAARQIRIEVFEVTPHGRMETVAVISHNVFNLFAVLDSQAPIYEILYRQNKL